MVDFKGVVPAIVTPMTPEGELNESAFREVIEFNIRSGVHGFWLAGGGGEGVLLSDEENARLAEIAADQARGRAATIMHVGTMTTSSSAKLAEAAARAGVDAICSVPPLFFRVGDDGIVEHYRAIAAAADLPLFLYNLPQCTGIELTPELIARIQERVPQLVGLKHSAPLFANNAVFSQMGLTCFTGSSKLMLSALAIGAAGCVDGILCAVPELYVDVWDAYNAGDLKRAVQAQEKANSVLDMVFKVGTYPATIKALVSERIGVECGDPRLPILPLTPEERTHIREGAEQFGLGKVAVA